MLPVMNPKHNIREIAKQMILLEDHLFQRSKRCHDCIRKHLTTIEAFAEEAITLDSEDVYTELCSELSELIRLLGRYLLENGLGDKLIDQAALEVAKILRGIRKELLKNSFDLLSEIKIASTCRHKQASRNKLAGELPANFFTDWKSNITTFLSDPNQYINFGGSGDYDNLFWWPTKQLLSAAESAPVLHKTLQNYAGLIDTTLEQKKEENSDLYSNIQDLETYSLETREDVIQNAVYIYLNDGVLLGFRNTREVFDNTWTLQSSNVAGLIQDTLSRMPSDLLDVIDQAIAEGIRSIYDVEGLYDYLKSIDFAGKLKSKVLVASPSHSDQSFYLGVIDIMEEAVTEFVADPVFSQFNLHGVNVTIVAEASFTEAKAYVRILDKTFGMLVSQGLGKALQGLNVFILGTDYEKLNNAEIEALARKGVDAKDFGRAGYYDIRSDDIKLMVPPISDLMDTIVHELGHRYWFRFMKSEQRAHFNALVQIKPSEDQRDYIQSVYDDLGIEKPIKPVSTYGKTSIEEAFAEAFAHFVLEKDMTQAQIESFRYVSGISKKGRLQRVADLYLLKRGYSCH